MAACRGRGRPLACSDQPDGTHSCYRSPSGRQTWPARQGVWVAAQLVPPVLFAWLAGSGEPLVLALAAALAACAGMLLVGMGLTRALWPETRWRDALANLYVRCIQHWCWLLIAFACAPLCSDTFDLRTWAVLVFGSLALCWFLLRGQHWAEGWLGFLAPAPPELTRLVDEVTTEWSHPPVLVDVLRLNLVQVAFYPYSVGVSQGMLRLLSAEQLRAILLPYVGYMHRSRRELVVRALVSTPFIAPAAYLPIVHAYGVAAYVVICVACAYGSSTLVALPLCCTVLLTAAARAGWLG